jgi:hypothetical protein
MRLRARAYLVNLLLIIVIVVINHGGVINRLLGRRSLALALDVGRSRGAVLGVGGGVLGGSVLASHVFDLFCESGFWCCVVVLEMESRPGDSGVGFGFRFRGERREKRRVVEKKARKVLEKGPDSSPRSCL